MGRGEGYNLKDRKGRRKQKNYGIRMAGGAERRRSESKQERGRDGKGGKGKERGERKRERENDWGKNAG